LANESPLIGGGIRPDWLDRFEGMTTIERQHCNPNGHEHRPVVAYNPTIPSGGFWSPEVITSEV
jgi:hypothetical protein